MAICLKCNKEIESTKGKQGISICMDCTTKIFDQLPIEIVGAMARVGIYALVDEATGYEKIRPKDELKQLLENNRKQIKK